MKVTTPKRKDGIPQHAQRKALRVDLRMHLAPARQPHPSQEAQGLRGGRTHYLSTCSGPSRLRSPGLWPPPLGQRLLRWALQHLQWLLLKQKGENVD